MDHRMLQRAWTHTAWIPRRCSRAFAPWAGLPRGPSWSAARSPSVDDGMGLSEPVEAAVPEAVRAVESVVATLRAEDEARVGEV